MRLVVALSLLSALTSPARAEGPDVGLQVEAGRVDVQSSAETEIDKTGGTNAFAIFWRKTMYGGAPQIAFGLQSTKVTGGDEARGFADQNYSVKAGFLDLQYAYGLPAHFGLGVVLRNAFGKGASFDVEKADDSSYAPAFGPLLEYTRHFGSWFMGSHLSYTFDVTLPKRAVNTLLFGLSVGYQLESKKQEEPAAPAPPPPPPPEPTPAPVPEPVAEPAAEPKPQVLANLDAKLVNFAFGSARIKAESKPRVLKIGKALASFGGDIKITVAGHTDSRGSVSYNEFLSEDRAKAVCSLLAEAGVKAGQLTCEGHAFKQPLPDLPTTAPEQRRVELKLSGISDKLAAKINEAIAEAMKP